MSTSHRPLLSENYRRLNWELHCREPTYGTTGRRYVDLVRRLAREFNARHILDYGCGKQDLLRSLGNEFDVRSFDPALPGLDARPEPADLVACIDVLEHVEPEYLDEVLLDLARVIISAALLTIATRPASKQLSDGTNCHRIVENSRWWLKRLKHFFRVVRVDESSANSLLLIVQPDPSPAVKTCGVDLR